jgi:16S rRNA processing protein RimM
MENLVRIGKTQKAHGLKGELKLNVEEYFIDDLFETEALFIELKGQKVPYFIENLQEGNSIILKLEGINSRNEAEQLAHKELFMRREDIHLSDEIINSGGLKYKFLEGFTIYDNVEGEIAVINEVAEFPQQEMAYITYKTKTLLIPLNDDIILEINREEKKVMMNLPEGILNL